MIFVQRQGVTGTVSFTGDAARILKDGQVVVDWTAGGSIAGAPQGDGYTLQVRTGATVVSDHLAIGVEVLTLGQSNMQGWFQGPAEHAVPASGAYAWVDGGWRTATGDGAREFAQVLGHDLGDVPVAFVDGSIGGTALLPTSSQTGQDWLQTGAGSLYQDAVDKFDAAGGRAELAIWTQGEQDAAQGRATAAQYAAGLTTLLQEVRADAPGAHILINGLGPTAYAPSGVDHWADVRQGQQLAAAAVADTHYVATDLGLELNGPVHLTDASRTWQALDLAKAALAIYGAAYSGPAEVHGGAGAEAFSGTDAAQAVDGGGGNDTLTGGAGDDLFRGAGGDDLIYGGGGVDIASGGAGADTVFGGAGGDELYGDDGADSLAGGGDNDLITGGDGNDVIDGGGGSDLLVGGLGDDLYLVDNVHDSVSEQAGEGYDIVRSTAAFSLPANVEALDLSVGSAVFGVGNAQDNRIVGGAGANSLSGGAGNDTLIAGGGNDSLDGGPGDDTLTGGPGNDALFGGGGADTAVYSGPLAQYAVTRSGATVTVDHTGGAHADGADTLTGVLFLQFSDHIISLATGLTMAGGDGADTLVGSPQAETITGFGGDDSLSGLGGDDQLFGGTGRDTLDGGAGGDTLTGGEDGDTYIVDSGGDVISETGASGVDVVLTALSAYTLGGGLETLTYTGAGTFSGVGNDRDNSLTGGGANDTLSGGAGGDTLVGGAGDDRLDGGPDRDSLVGGAGNDTYVVDSEQDHIVEAPGGGTDTVETALSAYALGDNLEGLVFTGAGDFAGTGNAGANRIVGGPGNDVIASGAGLDSVFGGAGDDTFHVSVNQTGSAGSTYDGGDGIDTLDLSGLAGPVTLTAPYTLPATFAGSGAASFSATNVEVVVGTAGDDHVDLSMLSFYADLHMTVFGGAGDDRLTASFGATEVFYGGEGTDYFDYVAPGDQAYGGAGSDFFVTDSVYSSDASRNATIDGGAGIDGLNLRGTDIANTASVDLSHGVASLVSGLTGNPSATYLLSSIENVAVSDVRQSVTITGDDASNRLVSTQVNNGRAIGVTLSGAGGDDWLQADKGTARLFGGDGDDTLTGASGNDSLDGGAGHDTAIYSGAHADYAVTSQSGAVTVQDLRAGSPDGFDTLTGVELIAFADGTTMTTGTPSADTLYGTSGSDTIYGLSGDDVVFGGAVPSAMDVSNTLYGGDGDDVLIGGYASDLLDGGDGNDSLNGSGFQYVNPDSSDTFYGGAGDDTVRLNRAYVLGSARLDLSDPLAVSTLTENGVVRATFSGVENLLLTLGSGDDSVVGGVGVATFYGGDGNDTLIGGLSGGYLSGGAGNDVLNGRGTSSVFYSSAGTGVHIDLNVTGPQNTLGAGTDTLIDVTGVSGSYYADTLIGTERADSVSGNSGSDLIYGAGGNDSLEAYPEFGQHATLYGGAGDDAITIGGSGATRGAADVYGGDGADTLTLGEDGPTVMFDGGAGADRVDGQLWPTGHVTLTLGPGSDTVSLTHDTSDRFFNASYEADIATITDFQAGAGGDVLDLAPLVAILGSGAQLHLVQIGQDTVVQFDSTGAGSHFLTAFTLSGVHASSLTAFNFGGLTVPLVLDVTAPTLARVDLPDTLSLDGQTPAFANTVVGATDAGSGVSSISLVFDRDWQGPNGPTHVLSFSAAGGGFSGGLASTDLIVETGSAFGHYAVVEADVADFSGNIAHYSTAQLAALGFDTGFDVLDARPAPPPPPPTPDVSVSAPATISEGDSFHLTLSFTGADTLPGTAFVTYNPYTPGSASPDDIDFSSDGTPYQVAAGADGTYTVDLPSHHANADSLHEGPETLVLTVQLPGHVFGDGTDTTTVSLTILNVDQTTTLPAQASSVAGSAGDDRIFGNVGNDTLVASSGADGLYGGGGADVLTYAGFSHDYALAITAGAGTVAGGPEGGNDTLSSIEDVRFLDGTLTFDTGSTAAQILRLYDSFVGRGPDVAGFDGYLKFFAAGHSFQDMAANAAASAEFHDATASLTDAQYIAYVYEHSLHREPDPTGLQNYLDALHSGALTRTSMIVQAAESTEHVALTAGAVGAGLWIPDEKVEGLELLYDAAVQRQPDSTGIAGYNALLAGGTSFRQIANRMASSDEFHRAHDGQTDAQYVDSLYVAEVGRHADASGLAAYVAELANGHTRGDVLYETAMSQEHQSHVLAYYDPLLIGA